MRVLLLIASIAELAATQQHMKRKVDKRQSGSVPLVIVNQCADTIYPAILSQGGTGPSDTGYGR